MMAYDNKFVASILVNGKPLRELNVHGKRTAVIPFGSEYIVRLKNKNTVRAKVSVSIDGTDVLCGKKLILNPNETVDLERFVDSHDGGSKFKFISIEQGEVTGEIQDPDNLENGRIVVTFEKEYQKVIPKEPSNPFITRSRGDIVFGSPVRGFDISGMSDSRTLVSNCVDTSFTALTNGAILSDSNYFVGLDISEGEKGATVEGSYSSQKFQEGEDFKVENKKTTLEIYLKGPSSKKMWALFVDGESFPRAQNENIEVLHGIAAELKVGFRITEK